HLVLLHRLEERGLHLRRRPVDLVREQDVREDRAPSEREPPLLGVEDLSARDVVRKEVGRELHALELEPERARERLREERLAKTGKVLDQEVAVRDQRGQHLLDRELT